MPGLRHSQPMNLSAITIRPGYADDEVGLATLASLDSSTAPEAPLLVAEVDGQLRAALSLRDGSVIADPFFHTLDIVDLLRARARGNEQPSRRRTWRRVRALRPQAARA
jgi:hypothetical protein